MNLQRGDVVLVDWPLAAGGQKLRPALVVQNDRDNRRVTNTIVVMITGQTKRALEPTQLLIDVASPHGQQTGLHKTSVVNCLNLITLEQSRIVHVIGRMPDVLLQQINQCLKVSLELP